ncbi:hypothetical protein EJ05DRAFT_505826 [Pseudovirgaria hyperparasitica]|uniref:Uncharacterized protein n=1 Tax=Pseudovirgaria hyperparasitica TaxID=470096 RepID=A0A6A6VS22_9PEZI|nr:uncharacterized protein EJ05DRAFT_505826 [Pseudovirgaria hyperparasitica]KAF2752709.1 hypothetical protein EJ05DRAFT_505826 [Pseudovirgaria hyperparasitica]
MLATERFTLELRPLVWISYIFSVWLMRDCPFDSAAVTRKNGALRCRPFKATVFFTSDKADACWSYDEVEPVLGSQTHILLGRRVKSFLRALITARYNAVYQRNATQRWVRGACALSMWERL